MDKLADAFSVLTDAVEDCTGLWEAVWELVGVPQNDSEAERLYDCKIDEAQSVLQQLLQNELVELLKGNAWPGGAEQETVIATNEMTSIFMTAKYWHPPEEGESYICFHATTIGKDVWRQGKQALAPYIIS